MDVRLVDADSLLTDATSALGSIDPLSALGGLSLPDLGSLDLGGLTSDLGSLGSLGSLFADGSLLNIPYNLFADVVNIPFYEAEALQEYAYALGPAGTAGGVAGWIPSWATVDNGGAVNSAEGLLYAVGRDRQLVRGIRRQYLGLGRRELAPAGRNSALLPAVRVH